MNTTKQGFTLIELMLVIIILVILFVASKNLFQTPNKYLIDGEVCINNIYGQLSQAFYQGVTGKDKVISGVIYEPSSYGIEISKWTGYSAINLYLSTGDNSYIQESENIIYNTWSSIMGCGAPWYTVMISWSSLQNSNDNINIIINKSLQNSQNNAWIKICRNYNPVSPASCISSFSEKIDFLICKKNPNNNIVDMASCKHTFSTRFDTATQSIKSNRCLNVIYEDQCKQWAIDNF